MQCIWNKGKYLKCNVKNVCIFHNSTHGSNKVGEDENIMSYADRPALL